MRLLQRRDRRELCGLCKCCRYNQWWCCKLKLWRLKIVFVDIYCVIPLFTLQQNIMGKKINKCIIPRKGKGSIKSMLKSHSYLYGFCEPRRNNRKMPRKPVVREIRWDMQRIVYHCYFYSGNDVIVWRQACRWLARGCLMRGFWWALRYSDCDGTRYNLPITEPVSSLRIAW